MWYLPVVPATQETETRGSPPRDLSNTFVAKSTTWLRLSHKARLHLRKDVVFIVAQYFK